MSCDLRLIVESLLVVTIAASDWLSCRVATCDPRVASYLDKS